MNTSNYLAFRWCGKKRFRYVWLGNLNFSHILPEKTKIGKFSDMSAKGCNNPTARECVEVHERVIVV